DETVFRVLSAYGLVDNRSPWRATGGIALLVFCGMASIFVYVFRYKRGTPRLADKLILVGLTIALVLIVGKGIVALDLGGAEFNALAGMLIPVSWATMTVAILIDVELALIVSVILAVFTGILVEPNLVTSLSTQIGLVALFGGIAGVHSVSMVSQRSDLTRAGLFVSAVNIIVISGLALMSEMRPVVWAVGVLLGSVNGLISSVFTVGTLHWFESGFNITSAVHLLELSNPNLPLLKRLLMEAPGTYHHSILVGNLAEAAAESVQADAILVRVGSMYHDIGKLKRPYFFIENQISQDNPHDKIAPTLSSLIITSHLKDGLELAKEYKLPEPIQDIISQHHGDSVVGFFFHKAREENEEVPEESFHYEAPRPQSKEAALVCLADSVEAAVRSLQKPTPGRIEGLVRKLIKDKLNDGQLDQSDLTLQDLDRIAMAFVMVLSGIFHSRVEYPDMPINRANGQESATNKKSSEDRLIDKESNNGEDDLNR
ncbi:MAG: HDIG domain-containing metalloprotein, partial [Desulfitobacteriaceae bacterium]